MLQRIKRCAVCGSKQNLQCHHIFYGYSRKAADKYGLTCWLCWEHHQGDTGVHHNIELDLDLAPYVKSGDKLTLFQDSGLALDTSITDPEKIASYWFIHPWPTSAQEGETLTGYQQKVQLQPRGGYVCVIQK